MTELYRFQKRGVAALQWFVGDRGAALLADDPGLGKTVQILEYVHRHLRRKTVVVVCPATVKTNWKREAATKYRLRAVVLSGTRPPKDAWRRMERGILYVVNPDILGAWVPHLVRLHPSLVVADEAHLFKSRKAKRTKALRVLGWGCKRRIAATGTPLPNYPSDLWSVANWLWPEEFPSFWSFASRYCNTPEAPIWMADLTFKPLGGIRPGDKVVGWNRREGRKHNKFLCESTVLSVSRRIAPIVKVTMASGKVIRCTRDHQWLAIHRNPSGSFWYRGSADEYLPAREGKYLCKAIEVVPPIPEHLKHHAGWLGGMFDGEGTWPKIAQCPNANPEVYERIDNTMDRLGFHHSSASSRNNSGHSIIGGRQAAVRFINWCKPTKTKDIYRTVLSSRFVIPDRVVSIQPDGVGEVVSMQTTTGNYVAWGYCSKNCKLERRPWGWEHKGADRLPELHTVLKALGMVRRKKADVLDDLPPKVRRAVPLELSDRRQYEEARDDFRRWARKNMRKALSAAQRAEGMTKAGYLFRLTGTLKLPAVETWVQDWLDNTEEKLILFARHRAVLKPLYARFKDAAVLVDGSVTGRHRDAAIDRFNKSRRCRLFLGNVLAAGVGWSAKGCTNVAFCEYPDRPADLTQAEDRAYGMFRGKVGTSTTVWLLTARGTVEEGRMDKLQTKQGHADAAIDGLAAGDGGLDLLGLLTQLIEEEVRK